MKTLLAVLSAGVLSCVISSVVWARPPLNLRAPFVSNRIDPSLFSKAAVTIASKLPKTGDPCGLVTYGTRIVTNEKQLVGKVDYQRSDKHSVFGRFMFTKFDQPVPYDLDSQSNLLNTVTLGFDDAAQSYVLGDTYLVSSTTVNSFRLAVNRTAVMRSLVNFFSAPEIGVNAFSDLKNINLTVNGAFR